MTTLRNRNDAFRITWRDYQWVGRWPAFKAAVHAWWCGNPFFDRPF